MPHTAVEPNESNPDETAGTAAPERSEDGQLSDEQERAYEQINDRLSQGERFTGLRGYAGTGKTYLVARLVADLLEEECPVHVCAPTHKAVQVLNEELDGTSVPMQTLHSYLGLRLQPGADGQYQMVPETDRNFNEGVVIVDEASMVGREEWSHIEQTPMFVQWLFVGDPAQLPPVNEDPSPALEVPGPTLTSIHRQAEDNPILRLATEVRKGDGVAFGSQYENGKGVGVTHDRGSFMDSALRAFNSKAFDDDATHARVLAYRNKTVRRYNEEIRTRRYGRDADRFVEGEWLVGDETWYHDGTPRIANSEEVRVQDVDIETFEASDRSEWTVWSLTVTGIMDDRTRTLKVLHEEEFDRFEEALERRRKKAEEDPSKWKRYYDLRERFAQVDYAYATTVHRAQGSTYDTVFVDHRDVQVCQGEERSALLYVAVTRPARQLALLV